MKTIFGLVGLFLLGIGVGCMICYRGHRSDLWVGTRAILLGALFEVVSVVLHGLCW